MSHRSADPEALTPQLAALAQLSRSERRARWRALYPDSRMQRLSREMVLRAFAYRLQEEALGGLDAVTRRRLARAMEEFAAGRRRGGRGSEARVGTRLLREWKGVVHEVVVLEDGVQFRGKTWSSLSAIAREITGAHWSGPRFFGLRSEKSGGRG